MMKQIRKLFILSILFFIPSAISCNSPSVPVTETFKLTKRYNGEKISTLDSIVNNYLTCDSEAKQAEFLYKNQNYHTATTPGVMFSWEDNHIGGYKVQIATDSEFKNIVISESANSTVTTIYNINPGSYYYRVVDKNNNSSDVDSFSFSNTLRTIKDDSTYINMRDLGGWSTTTGDVIKYGMLYRSALPSSVDLSLFNRLGIKTELDLRIKGGSTKDEIGSFKGIGGSIKWVMGLNEHEQYWPQYDFILTENKEICSNYFKKIFALLADENNYPIDFHCASGADRTGTLAYIINGLCGVSYENLTRDFEITSFYSKNKCRWRSDIKNDSGYYFDPSGKMLGADNVHWGYFHNQIMNSYDIDKSGNIAKAILNYLTSYCEVDKNLIKQALSYILKGNGYLSLFN